MSLKLKQDIVSKGGKKIETTDKHVKYIQSREGKDDKSIEGNSFFEVNTKLDEKVNSNNSNDNQSSDDTFNSLASSGSTQDGWDKTDGIWQGQTYIIYDGKTYNGTEFEYRLYVKYHWDEEPYWNKKDRYAIAWGSNATKVAGLDSNWSWWKTYTPQNGYQYNSYSTSHDASDLEGTEWGFSLSQSYGTAREIGGYGRETIRIPTSRDGQTFTFAGGYFHPWYSYNASISFYGIGISFSDNTGDKWSWDESFEIGS